MTTMQLTFEQQCLLMHATSQVVENLRALLTDEGILTTVERDRILIELDAAEHLDATVAHATALVCDPT